jgi:hypothetical protein
LGTGKRKMITLSRFILMATVLLASFGYVNAQTQTLTASQHWDVVNSLKIVRERTAYVRNLTDEQKAEFLIEHVNRKLKSMVLNDVQRQALIDYRDSITVEFVTELEKSPDGKSKNPAVIRAMSAMERAGKVIKQMYEIICLFGDRETLDDPNPPKGC